MNLRARILTGYGVVLALSGALALFLTLQLGSLSRQIAALNASSVAEAEAGGRVAVHIGDVRQAVDAYLRRPGPEAYALVERSFALVDAELEAMRPVLDDDTARARHAAIVDGLVAYRASWSDLSTLMDEQDALAREANMQVFEAGALAGHEVSAEFVVQRGGLDGIAELTEAQQALQLASLLLGRAVSDQDQPSAERALVQTQRAQALLERNAERPPASTGLLEARDEATRAVSSTARLAENIGRVRAVQDERLAGLALELSREAGTVAADEMAELMSATAELERRVVETQRIAGLALLATVATATLFGLQLARGLARPLVQLAAAVARVNGGDYDATVAVRDGGEIGQLAAAFNQMTTALRQQREQVQAQQAATKARNTELELALAELRAATAARDRLAGAVRALSVPVVPLMRNVIAVPLVGEIDAERAALLLDRVLDGVTGERARVVILDITGVPFVDEALAGWLLQTAAAAELLGARCVLTGISPEVAQALVASGADLGRIVTRADMRAGVEYALGDRR